MPSNRTLSSHTTSFCGSARALPPSLALPALGFALRCLKNVSAEYYLPLTFEEVTFSLLLSMGGWLLP